MVSPMSKGLFHRVIAVSGSIASELPINGDQIENARIQAKLSSCPTGNVPLMVECLKKVNDYGTNCICVIPIKSVIPVTCRKLVSYKLGYIFF
jgi:hypothetical protein